MSCLLLPPSRPTWVLATAPSHSHCRGHTRSMDYCRTNGSCSREWEREEGTHPLRENCRAPPSLVDASHRSFVLRAGGAGLVPGTSCHLLPHSRNPYVHPAPLSSLHFTPSESHTCRALFSSFPTLWKQPLSIWCCCSHLRASSMCCWSMKM